MKRDDLRQALTVHQLARVADQLVDLAAPTVEMRIRRMEEDLLPVSGSKVGGHPDLPTDAEWPAWYEPMAFLAQINLAEVAAVMPTPLLPDHGILFFFAAIEDGPSGRIVGSAINRDYDNDDADGETEYSEPSTDDLRSRWMVLFHEGAPGTMVRRAFPPELDDAGRFAAGAVRFLEAVTLPDPDGPEIASLHLDQHERSALITLMAEINLGHKAVRRQLEEEDKGCHLLGYPFDLADPVLLRADLELYRRASFNYSQFFADPNVYRRVLDTVGRQWCLLLQMDSVYAVDMSWDGRVYYCIERVALEQRNFGQAWLINMTRP